MGSLILCHNKKASQPYKITRIHRKIYTIETNPDEQRMRVQKAGLDGWVHLSTTEFLKIK